MKKNLFILATIILFLFVLHNGNAVLAQQWKFPIAFEDATGAKDTVFLVWDSTATMQLDSALGEYNVNLLHDVFQVYWAYNSDTTKVFAKPINNPYFNNAVVAKNYVYPIKISWDTSLFRSTSLPSPVNCAELANNYFFFSGTICETFNMLLTDSVMAPHFNWGSQEQFPLNIAINRVAYCCVNGVEENKKKNFLISPNPTFGSCTIIIPDEFLNENNLTLSVYTIVGKVILQKKLSACGNQINLNLQEQAKGMYNVILSNGAKNYYGKVILE